jgi:hypothetical protein
VFDKLKGWPPMFCDFTKGQWGEFCWDTDKRRLDPTVTGVLDEVRYLQSVLTRYDAATVKVDGVYGPETVAAVKDFQKRYGLVVDGIVGPHTWDTVDWVAFKSYWRQYRQNTNKYNHLPVDNHGLTRETSFIECLVRANFPNLKLNRNWMVDRMMRGSTTMLSEHAKGNALDFMFYKDVVDGLTVAHWIGDLETRLGLAQVIYNHNIMERGVWRRLLPQSLQHTDHIHVTCNSGKRPIVL